MKIVYCINSLQASGGTERVLTTKMNYLATTGECEVHVVLRDNSKKEFFPLSPAVTRHYVAVGQSQRAYKNALTDLLQQLKADIAICAGGSEISFLWGIPDGSKKILEFHYTKNFLINFVNGLHRLRFRKLHLLRVWFLQKRIAYYARKYDKLVGLTERDVQLWGCPANMTFIYNPLSFRCVRKSTLKNKRIIAVGSFTSAKGMDLLIQAFGRIAHRHPDWKLSLYGSGQDYDYLEELIARDHIVQQVTLHEPCQNIGDKLVECSIYAFPSRSDGFGLVLTEAMECGLPCVAFDCECGPREIVSSDTGILVPAQDVGAFALALERLMNDELLRERMGQAAQREVPRFYTERIMPQWLNLFHELREDKLCR